MGACLVMGFYSGLPLYLLFQLIPLWLRREGVDLATIGLFSLIQLPYSWKFLWAPLADGVRSKGGYRRKKALLPVQALLSVSVLGFAFLHPRVDLQTVVIAALLVAFYSATQDVLLDAYRRELVPDNEIGLGSSLFINAYRLSGLFSFSIAAIIADRWGYPVSFQWVAGLMLTAVLVTYLLPEPEVSDEAPATRGLRETLWAPLRDLLQRQSWQQVLWMLAFLFFYKLGDNMAVALATPFYVDMGFTDTEIGTVAKLAALWASVAGGILGGIWMLKISISRALWLFGAVQMISILGYIPLSVVGADPTPIAGNVITLGRLLLFLVVSFEYLGVGLGTVAIAAYMLHSASRTFGATQIALFTSLSALPRVLASASTGFLIEALGYPRFFFVCFLAAIPGMLLLLKVAPWRSETN
jgi:PAT family beta-lactamase induction signal transducer AmpG